ncbi:protein of unknown function [Cyanobium sp. NIES-981]|nr:protein of unknown function [Cyanobium sp. NIES-981]
MELAPALRQNLREAGIRCCDPRLSGRSPAAGQMALCTEFRDAGGGSRTCDCNGSTNRVC